MISRILDRVQFFVLFLRQWLAKQAEARKIVQAAKQADPASIERDPLWYKDRGKYVSRKIAPCLVDIDVRHNAQRVLQGRQLPCRKQCIHGWKYALSIAANHFCEA